MTMFKYIEKGEEKSVHIIKESSHKWKEIACLVCDSPNKVDKLEEQYRGNHDDCLRQTLADDFLGKKPTNYSHNWSGLIELLNDVGLEALAQRVKHALLNA